LRVIGFCVFSIDIKHIMHAKPSELLRLFFALWPDDATASALMQLQSPMRGRTIPYANLHLTLVFLGQQPAARLPEFKDILARLPRTDISLILDRLGYFQRKRIAWVGPSEAPGALLALQSALVQSLRDRAVVFNSEHNYKPHVTLARDASLPADMTFDPIVWHAQQAVLVESVTTAEGPIYRVVASRSLDEEVWGSDEVR
jgi:RNA 2',3'-cyclic 3'-phosphodiesterase